MKKKSIISIQDVTVELGDRKVLDNINLEVEQGDFVAVLGPNGSGKSTLINLILGLIKPQNGKVKILGSNAAMKNYDIGYSPQSKPYDTDIPITGEDYVRLGLVPRLPSLNFQSKKENRKIQKVLKELDAEALGKKKLGKMSGGEQQRISLAQALVGDPHLLLLDEPLANLDISYQSEILQRIYTFHKEHNHTVLLVAHDVNPLLPYINKVIYLANSHARIGNPMEVIREDVLSELYGTSVKVFNVDDRIFVAAIDNINH